jgi:hypothetical protein
MDLRVVKDLLVVREHRVIEDIRDIKGCREHKALLVVREHRVIEDIRDIKGYREHKALLVVREFKETLVVLSFYFLQGLKKPTV